MIDWNTFNLSFTSHQARIIYSLKCTRGQFFWRTCTEDLEKKFGVSLIIILHIIFRKMAEDISFLFQKSPAHKIGAVGPNIGKLYTGLGTGCTWCMNIQAWYRMYMVCRSGKRKYSIWKAQPQHCSCFNQLPKRTNDLMHVPIAIFPFPFPTPTYHVHPVSSLYIHTPCTPCTKACINLWTYSPYIMCQWLLE